MKRMMIAPAVVVFIATLIAGSSPGQTTSDKRQPRLMTSYKWAWLDERQHQIYVKGFLETASFVLYGHSRRDDPEQMKIFADWTACAEREPLSKWQTLDWTVGRELAKTAAEQFYDQARVVCKDSVGKGDKTWRLVWLIKPPEWRSLSLHDRAIYLMAYVETAFAAARRARDAAIERTLDLCIAGAGIEGLISSMERTTIEWQFPMPWSVSRALGATCKGIDG